MDGVLRKWARWAAAVRNTSVLAAKWPSRRLLFSAV
jgi:hypothetical protein